MLSYLQGYIIEAEWEDANMYLLNSMNYDTVTYWDIKTCVPPLDWRQPNTLPYISY